MEIHSSGLGGGDEALLRQRAIVAIRVIVVAVVAIATTELILRWGQVPIVHVLHAADLVFLGCALAYLRRDRRDTQILAVVFVVIAAQVVTSACVALASGKAATSTISLAALSMGSAALLPLRWHQQLALVAFLGMVYPIETYTVGGWLEDGQARETAALYIIFIVSVLISWQLQRQRDLLAEERAARIARERELESSRSFLHQVIDIIPSVVLAKDRDGRITLVNRAVAAAYGCAVADLIGKRDADIHPFPDEVARFAERDAEVFRTGQPTHETTEIITAIDGRPHTFETTRRPIVGVDGQVEQVLSVAIDVTDHKQAMERVAAEGRIATSLANMGLEVITSLNQPDLLQRLCALAVRHLHADFAQLWLWDREGTHFEPAAHSNFPEPLWEAARLLSVPRSLVARLAERAERGEVSFVLRAEVNDQIPHALLDAVPELYAFMVIPLRRGNDLSGILGVGYLRERGRLDSTETRVAQGLSHLASLALENARLLDQLARANRLKSEFVATMSHELRTPLNVILGYVDLMLDEAFGEVPSEQKESLVRVRANAMQLLELINTTLDLSRLEAGRVPVEVGVIEPAAFIAEVRDLFSDGPRNADVRLEWQMDASCAPLRTDIAKLKVILQNLVRNALKFTEHGRITIRLGSSDTQIDLAVSDTGIGIAQEDREAIFEAFRQGDRDTHNIHGGVGLGLYIVQRLVELLGGTLTLQSELDVGSTFHVVLPQAEPRSARGDIGMR